MPSQKYSTLSQTHPCYNKQDILKKRLLYVGGEDIIESAALFIPQNLGERDRPYRERLAGASYVNYMASIVDYFAANLFSKELMVLPAADDSDDSTPGELLPDETFYRAFAADADLTGNNFPTVLKGVFRQAMVSGCGYLGIDFPKVDTIPASLAEEEQLGVGRAYTYEVEEASVINWDLDDLGNFKWCVLRKEFPIQETPFTERDKKKVQFKVWLRDGDTVSWQLFEIVCKINGQPRDRDDVPMVDSGTTSFKQIPILRLSPTKGLWIGNKIGTLVSDHFRMRSTLFHAQNKSLYAMPVFKQGAELPGDDSLSVINEDTDRGAKAANTFMNRGFQVTGPNDEIYFAEPTGACYQLINDELKEHVDEIFRTVSQMAQSVSITDGGSAKSAASKMADNHAMEMLLSEYGALMRQFAAAVYNCISDARSEDVVWQSHGLSNYEILDRQQLIAEAMAFQEKMIDIPSITFKKIYATKLAQAFAPNVAPEVQITIENEITEWFDKNEQDVMDQSSPLHEHELAIEQAKATKPALAPGQNQNKKPAKK